MNKPNMRFPIKKSTITGHQTIGFVTGDNFYNALTNWQRLLDTQPELAGCMLGSEPHGAKTIIPVFS